MDQRGSYLEKPWLKSYKLGPYKLEQSLEPYAKEPVYQALDRSAERYPAQTAILFKGRSLNYHQLKDQVDRLANALVHLGITKGDRVCIYLPNCFEFIISDWAIQKTGAAVVPTSILRTADELIYEVGSSGSRIIICREDRLDRALVAQERCNIEHIIVTSQEGYDVQEVSSLLPPRVLEFRKLIHEAEPQPPNIQIDPMEDLCEVAFTGGATGIPKGVMISHYNCYSSIQQGVPWFLKPMLRGFVGKASVLIPIPLFHTYGHFTQLSAAYLGMRIILMPDPRDTDQLVEYIQKYRPFLLPGVPTQFMRIAQANLSRMNVLLLSGSAPLPSEIAEEVKRKTGMPISEGYGLTETSSFSHINVSAFSKITGFMAQPKTGIGIPAPDTECKLVDPDTGAEVPFGQAGEIVVRGPQVMKGYWPEPGSGLTKDGWLHTGDIGVMDEDGYFQIVDRTKDMVNVSGMKVYTTKVDDVLFKHPGVLMAAAFGVPDADIPGSERVMAVIRLKDSYQEKVSAEEIKEFCRERLAPYEVPKYIEFKDDLPLSVTEKVFKKVLREEAIAKMKA